MTIGKIKGFSDYTGTQAENRAEIKKVIQQEFELYGFEPAETPIIENQDFVQGNNQQDEAVSDIFKLQDKGKRKLALRYEFTFQLKRISQNKKLPYKRYEIGPVFRDEPVTSNRFRQFTQCDVDTIGSGLNDEAEILALTGSILQKLGIDFEIYFNNRKLLNEILVDQKIKEEYQSQVIKEIDKLDKLPEKQVLENLKKYNAEKLLKVLIQPEKSFEKYSFYKEIKELKKTCKNYGIDIKFQPFLARGLSYYNSSIFEIKSPNKKETICAGGSYLINKVQATGISLGLERLAEIAKLKKEKEKFLIISIDQNQKAIELAEKLRQKNKPTILLLDKSPGKALDYANAREINWVILIGEEEVRLKKFKLKNMETGKEKLISLTELLKV